MRTVLVILSFILCISYGSAQTTYVGCFIDTSSRDLSFRLADNIYASPSLCASRCAELNYEYAGLQYSVACFCGNSYGSHGEDTTPNGCNMPCAVDSSQICGDAWRNSIYRTGINYIGCFIDSSGTRDLSVRLADHTYASPDLCVNQCRSLGYDYAGVQFTYACFCGNSYGTYGEDTSQNACSMPCAADSTQICGDAWRNSIYITGKSYIGCFIDSSPTRDLRVRLADYTYASPRLCVNQCRSLGYDYAGVQFSYACFCDNSYGTYGIDTSPNACSMSCAADSGQICGGSWRNSIYDTRYDPNISISPVNEPNYIIYGIGGLIGLLLLLNILCLCLYWKKKCGLYGKYKSYQKVVHISTDVDSSCDDMQNLNE